MGKRDYVLEKAIAGDLDALENVLGRVVAPVFDVAFLYLGDAAAATGVLESVLARVAGSILDDALAGERPAVFAMRELLGRMPATGEQATWIEEHVAGLSSLSRLRLLVESNADLDTRELELAFGDEASGDSGSRERFLRETGIDEEAWRALLDKRAGAVRLPEGVVDRVVSRFEADD